jgi:hypothetical protein
MADAPVETERKRVLHQHPARRHLGAWVAQIVSIDQVYLSKIDGVRRRLRKPVHADRIDYELCSKRRLAPGVALESTVELSAREYDQLAGAGPGAGRCARPAGCPVPRWSALTPVQW